jgi:hypothetical protein
VVDDVCVTDLEGRFFTPAGRTAAPFLNIERFVRAELV